MKKIIAILVFCFIPFFSQAAVIGQQATTPDSYNLTPITGNDDQDLPVMTGTLRSFDIWIALSNRNSVNNNDENMTGLRADFGGAGCPTGFVWLTPLNGLVIEDNQQATAVQRTFVPNVPIVYAGETGCTLSFTRTNGPNPGDTVSTATNAPTKGINPDDLYFVGYDTSSGGGFFGSSTTRIISTDPYHNETIATGTITLSAYVFISADDFEENTRVTILANYLDSLDGDIYYSFLAPSAGYYTISTTTRTSATVLSGEWKMTTEIFKPAWSFFGFGFGASTLAATTTDFITGTLSAYQQSVRDARLDYADFVASSTITYDLNACNPISGFDFLKCLSNLFVPSSDDIQTVITDIKNGAFSRFPFGYIQRVAIIFTSQSSTTIPVFQATIPLGVVGGGSSITLDPNYAIDFILNSKASDSGFGTSTETFYETTSYYWEIFVYICLVLYIMRRVLGSGLITSFKKKEDDL